MITILSLNGISLVMLAVCAAVSVGLVARSPGRLLSFVFLWCVLLIYGFVAVGNLLEHGWGKSTPDRMEEYVEITLPLLYLLFILSLVLRERTEMIEEQRETLGRWNDDLEHQIALKARDLERTYASLADARVALTKQERSASLTFLIRKIAHLISTPLGISITSASFLKDRVRDDKERVIQDLLENNLRHISNLIDEIRKVNELLENEDPMQFNMQEEIRFHLENAGTAKGYNFEYELKADGDMNISGFPVGLGRVMDELVENSVVHNPGLELLHIRIFIRNTGDAVTLFFRDNGTGVDPKIREKIFDPLFTPQLADRHFGMGLYLAKNIVTNLFDGDIDVLAETPGAAFRIVFPVHQSGRDGRDKIGAGYGNG